MDKLFVEVANYPESLSIEGHGVDLNNATVKLKQMYNEYKADDDYELVPIDCKFYNTKNGLTVGKNWFEMNCNSKNVLSIGVTFSEEGQDYEVIDELKSWIWESSNITRSNLFDDTKIDYLPSKTLCAEAEGVRFMLDTCKLANYNMEGKNISIVIIIGNISK